MILSGRWRAAFAVLAITAVSPIRGQQAADQGAGADLRQFARAIGDATSGQRAGGGDQVDKVIIVGRQDSGELVVAGIQVVPRTGGTITLASTSDAVLRTRAIKSAAPEAEDRALAESRSIPVFIVGEWTTPATIREIGRHDGKMMFRVIDATGGAGAWQQWPR